MAQPGNYPCQPGNLGEEAERLQSERVREQHWDVTFVRTLALIR